MALLLFFLYSETVIEFYLCKKVICNRSSVYFIDMEFDKLDGELTLLKQMLVRTDCVRRII